MTIITLALHNTLHHTNKNHTLNLSRYGNMGDYDASPRNATDYGAALTVKLEKAVMQRVEYLHAGTYVR